MILSASRRTDIPAFFPDWFMNRLRDGYVLVRNPMNYHQVSKIELSPAVLDCIVFWTKNPRPILRHLAEIGETYPFYFQYTLNAYGKDVEQNLPNLGERIHTLQTLSDAIGNERVIWRYDPVLLSPVYDVRWHVESFGRLAKELAPFVESVVFSYFDPYPKVENNTRGLGIRPCVSAEMETLAQEFSRIARANRLTIKTCAEAIDLEKYGIEHNCCIDPKLIESLAAKLKNDARWSMATAVTPIKSAADLAAKTVVKVVLDRDGQQIKKITGYAIRAKKDSNQRPECGCAESIDIGQYNTCCHGCRYCYANFNPKSVETFLRQHVKNSPLLIGQPENADKVTTRKMKLLRVEQEAEQLSLFQDLH